ncbi:hypothetical protein LFZ56_20955 [Salmonella bongori serovar 66:z41:- str. SA19983605]|uniref:Uncharacterized protein n=1 Tax=Salmonella bongori serovar 66:z41:- str. SA19983605 TaxID=1243617 RepID=A0A248KDZ3_SALBN|nr:hypothetical protein LFZ56_20955 [Salmonella bongori serovar 66:z41:- str. SA19983605]
MTEIVIKGYQSHLKFSTLKRVKTVIFSRNQRKDREMRRASHQHETGKLMETVNAITFIFAMLPAANSDCH